MPNWITYYLAVRIFDRNIIFPFGNEWELCDFIMYLNDMGIEEMALEYEEL